MLPEIQKYLQEKQIFSIGRYGNWEYAAMENAIFQGMETADLINGKTQVAKAAIG